MERRAGLLTGAVIGWLVAASPQIYAQTAPPATSFAARCADADRIDAQLAQSAQAFAARDSGRGMTLLRDAFDQSTRLGCTAQRAEALLRLGIGAIYEHKLDEARATLSESAAIFRRLEIPEREATALTLLGNAFITDGRSREAAVPLLRARELARQVGDTRLELRILSNLTYALDEGPEKNRFREDSLAFARATPGGRATECDLLHEWGDSLFGEDRYREAFPILTDAVRCFQETGQPAQVGRAYVSLGRVYRAHGRLAEALEQYSRAVALQQASEGDRLAAVQSLNAIGVTLGFMGRYTEGLERLQEALGIARRLRSERTVSFLLGNIATFHLDEGRYAQAAAVLEEIVAAPATAFEVIRLCDLSRAYVGLKQHQRALEIAQRAVAAARSDTEQVSALTTRADAFNALRRFDEASADLQRALAAVESIRANTVADDFLKRGFSQKFQYLFSSSIALLEDEGLSREAVETAERGRARAFLDLLASRERATSSATSTASASSPATFTEIAATAARLRSTVLAFWVGSSQTFVWVVKPDGTVASARIALPATAIASMVRDATGGDTQAQLAAMMLGSSRATRPWRALHRTLIEPIRRHLPARAGSRLTIVPHGPLLGLPFAALRDASGRYLIESYELHYVPAINALGAPRASSSRGASALLVGDPGPEAARDRIMALPALPWADREVTAIHRLLPTGATVLKGRDATEANVRQHLEDRSLLHFATHGIVQNEENLASYLALRPSDESNADGPSDGRLTANETYGLKLNADLIVLSGCRTALGPIMGDGVIGFTRAFLAAGAESVVATMWDVADQTSYEVMKSFYASWVGGADRSAALRRAQLSVLRSLRNGTIRVNGVALPESPRLWAGYVLVGQP